MKKFVILIAVMILAFVPSVALAEGGTTLEFFDWAELATVAGATAATLLITEFLKFPLDKVWKIPTRVLVYFIALVIILVATYFTDGLTLNNSLMACLNAFVVALAAYGSYQITFEKIEH